MKTPSPSIASAVLGALSLLLFSAEARAEFDETPGKTWAFNDIGTNSAQAHTNDSDYLAGRIPTGTTLTVSTCGLNNGTDTYLRLWSSTRGAWIAADDDGCGVSGGGSKLTFTTTQTEDILVRVGCYANAACNGQVAVSADVTVAQRWAPVIYHDTYSTDRRDQITKFDFDGDFIATNNRANTASFSHPAWVYYSFVRTSAERYISYYFFHSDDVAHEN